MELPAAAKELQAPLELVRDVAENGRLPVVLFCAGGIATPADAALMMQLGAEGNFVGSGIFKSSDPARRARAIVEATTHFEDPERVAAASRELGEPMAGLEIGSLEAPAAAGCCRPRLVSRSHRRGPCPAGRLRGAREGARASSARETRTVRDARGARRARRARDPGRRVARP